MEASSLKDRVPPHNEEAERATLGALLLDSENLAMVLQFLRPEDFYRNAHKNIFRAILNLYNAGEGIDLITLTEALRADNTLESCGGAGYVASVTTDVPTSANVSYYAKIVQACSLRRELIRISHTLISTAQDESKEVRGVLEKRNV